MLDTPIDESLFYSELLKSPEIADELDKVPKVRADHYETLTGKDAHSEALAGEEDDYKVLTGGGKVACSVTFAGEDDNSEAPTVKDGQQFVYMEGFEEDSLVSKAKYKKRTLMLDMPDPSTHSMTSHNHSHRCQTRV